MATRGSLLAHWREGSGVRETVMTIMIAGALHSHDRFLAALSGFRTLQRLDVLGDGEAWPWRVVGIQIK